MQGLLNLNERIKRLVFRSGIVIGDSWCEAVVEQFEECGLFAPCHGFPSYCRYASSFEKLIQVIHSVKQCIELLVSPETLL